MGFGVKGLGFQDFGCRILGFMDAGYRVEGLGFGSFGPTPWKLESWNITLPQAQGLEKGTSIINDPISMFQPPASLYKKMQRCSVMI